jgi:hypothetical protein
MRIHNPCILYKVGQFTLNLATLLKTFVLYLGTSELGIVDHPVTNT